LKDCAVLPYVLEWLAQSGHSTLVYTSADRKSLERAHAPNLKFERERLDMSIVAKECDVAILHATHGTTSSILIAGKPVMLLPIFLEQGLMGHAVCQLGAGTQAPASHREQAIAELEKVVSSQAYAASAKQFASKYAGYNPVDANERLLDRIDEVLSLPTNALVA
jgi:UDP:flavonoid glycosyltransferase YjiC (YdhE family)